MPLKCYKLGVCNNLASILVANIVLSLVIAVK